VLALITLAVARLFFPSLSHLGFAPTAQAKGFTASNWIYMIAATCFGAGLMSFELVSYHYSSTGVVTDFWIPLFLVIATATGVVASLVFGRIRSVRPERRPGCCIAVVRVLAAGS
jgi:hypothetical protein